MRSVCTATRAAPTQLEKARVQQWRLSAVKKKSLHSTSKHLGFPTWVGHTLSLSSSLKSGSSVVSSTLQGPLYAEEFIKGIVTFFPNNWLVSMLCIKRFDSGPNLESPLHANLTQGCTLLCYPVFSSTPALPLPFSLRYMCFQSYLKSGISGREMNKCSDI